MKKIIAISLSFVLISFVAFCTFKKKPSTMAATKQELVVNPSNILSYIVDLKTTSLDLFWQNEAEKPFKNFNNLKSFLAKENKELIFAMNGGMFNKDLSPQGLYIEKGEILTALDTIQESYGNFYLQPNGVFYWTQSHKPSICTTTAFEFSNNIKYATQSGPMLVIDGQLHPKFNKGSKNTHIRNGVGILPNGNLLFAMSKEKINFYDFASFFKQNACENALYLDGFVSRTYLPAKNHIQLDGNFGLIIAATKPKK